MIKKYIDDIDDIDFRWGTGRDCEFFGSAFGDRWSQHAGGGATHHIPAWRNQKFDWLQVGSKVLGEGGRRVGDANVLESGTPLDAFGKLNNEKALEGHLPFAIHLPPVLRVNLGELSVCDGGARNGRTKSGADRSWNLDLRLGPRLGRWCQNRLADTADTEENTVEISRNFCSSCLGLLWQRHGSSSMIQLTGQQRLHVGRMWPV